MQVIRGSALVVRRSALQTSSLSLAYCPGAALLSHPSGVLKCTQLALFTNPAHAVLRLLQVTKDLVTLSLIYELYFKVLKLRGLGD